MKRELIVVLGLSVVAIPSLGEACSTCSTLIVQEAFPGLFPVARILLGWLALHCLLTVIPAGLHRIGTFTAYTAVVGALTVVMFGVAGMVLAILGCMLRDLYTKGSAIRSRSGGFLERVGFGVAILALLIALVVGSVIQNQAAKMDPFERFMTYSHVESPKARGTAMSFARDPEFDIERLRPALESQSYQSDLAIAILSERTQPAHDLIRFADVLAEYPEETFDGKSFGAHFRLRMLFTKAGLPTINSSADFKAWVEETRSGRNSSEPTNLRNEDGASP